MKAILYFHKGSTSVQNLNYENLCPNAKAPTFIKEALLKFKTLMKPHTLIVREFSKPVPPLDRTTRQKLNKETKEKIEVMTPLCLTDNYTTCHPNTKVYTFFSTTHGAFSKIEHILGYITKLNIYKRK